MTITYNRLNMNHKIIGMYKNGFTISEISKRLKYSRFIINRVLRNAGIETKKPDEVPDEVTLRFIEHVKNGHEMARFSRECGFSVLRLRTAAKRFGFVIRLVDNELVVDDFNEKPEIDEDFLFRVVELSVQFLENGLTIRQAFDKAIKEAGFKND